MCHCAEPLYDDPCDKQRLFDPATKAEESARI